MQFDQWLLDSQSGHCSHPLGLVAYIDLRPTPSGAIRCLGPFASKQLPSDKVIQATESLSKAIEDTLDFGTSYVIWGAYSHDPDYEEHSFPILGSTCAFLPSFSLRARLTTSNWYSFWTVERTRAYHPSGLVFGEPGELVVDPCVFHPATFDAEAQLAHDLLKDHLDLNEELQMAEDIHKPTWHRALNAKAS